MRYQYLILFFLLVPAKIFAQTAADTDITGLWKGTLYNDTTKEFYQYEIGISDKSGKLSGFSHTWFIQEDKQYYGVKKVKIKRQDGKIIIEDAGLIANNYPVAPAKGVRQLNVLELNAVDSIMVLTGSFTTNATKSYRPLTGSIKLERKNDYWQSALVPHLQELNLVKDLSFVKDDMLLAKNNELMPGAVMQKTTAEKTIAVPGNSPIAGTNISAPVTTGELAKRPRKISEEEGPTQLSHNKSDTVYVINSTSTVHESEKKTGVALLKRSITENGISGETKEAVTATTQQPQIKQQSSATAQPVGASPSTGIDLRPAEQKNIAARDVNKRTTLLQQTVSFKSDSLQLSLYDNGEVDGDTVSVLMNGTIIMAKERLSTNAVRKTIYIPQNVDTVQLVMYAENLGLIPPNTGLLVVKDGKDIYEIRFSGDL